MNDRILYCGVPTTNNQITNSWLQGHENKPGRSFVMHVNLSVSSISMGLRPFAARAWVALCMNASLKAFSLAPLPQPQIVASFRPGDGNTFMKADMISLQSAFNTCKKYALRDAK